MRWLPIRRKNQGLFSWLGEEDITNRLNAGLPGFDDLVKEVMNRDFSEVEVILCYRAISRCLEDSAKAQKASSEIEQEIKENWVRTDGGKQELNFGAVAKGFFAALGHGMESISTHDAAKQAIFRLVSWKYENPCDLSFQEVIQIKDILELRYKGVLQNEMPEIKGEETLPKALSPAERQIQSTRDRIEMMKAGSNSLAEVIRARDEVLSRIDQGKEPDRYEMEKRRWNDFIMELMEKGK